MEFLQDIDMEPVKKISTPLTDEQIGDLRAGDQVVISGVVYGARDQAHKRLCELLDKGGTPPFDMRGAVVYYVGPTPATEGRTIGSAGPTTAMRMDAFTPALLRAGLKGTIGKGYRGPKVQEAMVRYGAVHFAAMGGFGALLSKYITSSRIVAYEDLGTEAIRELVFEDFPAVVAYDCYGKTVYK
jgi:fumarate hydratase subunit beta